MWWARVKELVDSLSGMLSGCVLVLVAPLDQWGSVLSSMVIQIQILSSSLNYPNTDGGVDDMSLSCVETFCNMCALDSQHYYWSWCTGMGFI
jgi:hypothetical protein